MRILLVGEYSRLHNSLKEGLLELGHEVILISNGDGFKNYPCDYSIDAKWSKSKVVNIARQAISRIFNYDIARLEQGFRFYSLLPKLHNFDVVQLINEAPINTDSSFELHILKRLKLQNNKMFLLSCGFDYKSITFALDKKLRYSILTPYFEDISLKSHYRYVFPYIGKAHKKLHDYLFENCNAIIASDIDYVLPLEGEPKFKGMIPNPVNASKLTFNKIEITDKIIIFLGINQWNAIQKGIQYFEKALDIIRQKYPDRIEIIITKNVPYTQYIESYNKCHILLDQVLGYDQGYNALEAMAKGKTVFTGAEKEFMDYYKLTERVAINAIPDVASIVDELSFLIENPQEIIKIGRNAREFIEREHDYILSAEKYLSVWNNN